MTVFSILLRQCGGLSCRASRMPVDAHPRRAQPLLQTMKACERLSEPYMPMSVVSE